MIRDAMQTGTRSDLNVPGSEAVRVTHGTRDLDLIRAVLERLAAADATTNGR